jgi:hypothetical protein
MVENRRRTPRLDDPEVESLLDDFARELWERRNPEDPTGGDGEWDDRFAESFYDAFLYDCGDR